MPSLFANANDAEQIIRCCYPFFVTSHDFLGNKKGPSLFIHFHGHEKIVVKVRQTTGMRGGESIVFLLAEPLYYCM